MLIEPSAVCTQKNLLSKSSVFNDKTFFCILFSLHLEIDLNVCI